MVEEIGRLTGERILNSSEDDLVEYFVEKYSVDVPTLDVSSKTLNVEEVDIDVSQDRNRYISDRNRPFYLKGTRVTVTIPFTGDAVLFDIRPSTFSLSPPIGTVSGTNLLFVSQGTALSNDAIQNELSRWETEIQTALDRQRTDFSNLNAELSNQARSIISNRRKKLLADKNLAESLGIPLTRRPADTFTAPEVKRN